MSSEDEEGNNEAKSNAAALLKVRTHCTPGSAKLISGSSKIRFILSDPNC